VRGRIVGACRAKGFAPRIVAEVATSLSVLGLVAAGTGIGLVIRPLRAVARAGIVFRPLHAPGLDLPFGLGYRSADQPALLPKLRNAVSRAWPGTSLLLRAPR